MKQKRVRSESNYRRAKINSWCKLLENDFDWDYVFLLKLERKKIAEMYNYFKKCTRTDKMPFVARDLLLCIKLLDIVLEKDDLRLEFSEPKFERKNNDIYEMVECPRITNYRHIYINTRNADRFSKLSFSIKDHDIEIINKDTLRKDKAWNLYNKIRCDKIYTWWD